MQLSIQRLSKQYGASGWGLRDFSLDLKPGVTGLLGPNGAGKSTLMRILATISRPSAGRIVWEGLDVLRSPDPVRRVLGYLPQDFGVYPNLNAIEFLEYLAAVKGLEPGSARRRIAALLDMVNLTAAARQPLGGYSGGMRQRVGIAQALLNDPQLLIVDEPTVGLDPHERANFRNLLSELGGDRIILLSTHIVSDVEAAASEIAILHQGRLLAHDTPEALLARVAGRTWLLSAAPDELPQLRDRHLISSTLRRREGLEVRIVTDQPPAGAKPVEPTLEDAYLALVGHGRKDRRSGEDRSGTLNVSPASARA